MNPLEIAKLLAHNFSIGDFICRLEKTEEDLTYPEGVWAYFAWYRRSDQIGHGRVRIEPTQLWWVELAFDDAAQGEGIYTNMVAKAAELLPPLGITHVYAPPASRQSALVLSTGGFEHGPRGFALHLEGDKARVLREYKAGKRGEPRWRASARRELEKLDEDE
jgi:hypothetical protein